MDKPKGFRVAAVQYLIEGNQELEQFLGKFERLTLAAVQSGAKLVVFPELFTLDAWPLNLGFKDKDVVALVSVRFTPALHRRAAELSAKHGIAILVGSSPRQVGARVFNTALLVFPDGRKVMQDKLFLTPWEKKQGWSTGKDLKIFETPWGKTSILICFDAESPVVSNRLASHRPEVLLVPSMTESDAGLGRVRWTSQARAIEHHAYVIVAGTVGNPTSDWNHHGQAAFLSPWEGSFPGLIAEGAKNSPEIVYADLDLESLRTSRLQSGFFPAKEQEGREVVILPDLKKHPSQEAEALSIPHR